MNLNLDRCNIQLLQLDKTIIPNIPFIWYREEQLLCPFDIITKDQNYKIIQRHVLGDANLYIGLHSLMYYTIHKDTINEKTIINIPGNYNRQIHFKVKVSLIEGEIKEIQGGIKLNEYVNGSVFIHGASFSPPGCFHFKVNNELEKTVFLCDVECDVLKIKEQYQFVLINACK